jgi:hypothetical protein
MDNRKTGYPRGHTRRRLMVELVIGLVVLAAFFVALAYYRGWI